MSLFNSMFNQSTFLPDYRDTILFNGYLPYRATGKFKANLIELELETDPSTIIYFNTNLSRQQYLTHHDRFEIFRNKDRNDFTIYSQQMSGGLYFPTGRWFFGKHAKYWEVMRENDPMEVMYSRDFPFSDDNFFIGRQCSEITLISNGLPKKDQTP